MENKNDINVNVLSVNKNEEKQEKKKRLFKFSFVLIFVINILLNLNIYAVNMNTFADGNKDITGLLLGIFISIGVVLILLCLAIIVKINTLKKAADTINEYIRMFGMPKKEDFQNNMNGFNGNRNF